MSQPNPFAHLFGRQQEEQQHQLSDEAQAENLRAAWQYYSAPKSFAPGQLVKERDGLGIFNDRPVLLYVRPLDPENERDNDLIRDLASRTHWNKLNCIVARASNDAAVLFMPIDSDLLEPWP